MLSREMSNHRTKERSAEPSTTSLGPSAPSWPRPPSPRAGGCGAGARGLRGGRRSPRGRRGRPAGRGGGAGPAAPPRLRLSAPSSALSPLPPPSAGWGWVGVMPAAFCRSTGPWLYGDGEARTQYVQNEFCTSKVERHPFDKGPFGEGYHRKRRVSRVPKGKAGSWHRA